MKQLKLNIEADKKIVNKNIKEEFALRNATIYGGYNLFSDYLRSNALDHFLEKELGISRPTATKYLRVSSPPSSILPFVQKIHRSCIAS